MFRSPEGRRLRLCPEVTLGDGVHFCSGVSVGEPHRLSPGGSLQRPRGHLASLPVSAEPEAASSSGRMRAGWQLCGRLMEGLCSQVLGDEIDASLCVLEGHCPAGSGWLQTGSGVEDGTIFSLVFL